MKKILDKIVRIINEEYFFCDGETIDDVLNKIRIKFFESKIDKNGEVSETEEVKRIRFKELASEIFELCPECNCIPLAIEIEYGNEYEKIVDFDEMYYDYLGRGYLDKGEYIRPKRNPDMTFGVWKNFLSKWMEMVKMSGFNHEKYKLDNYCEYGNINTYVYRKNFNDIKLI